MVDYPALGGIDDPSQVRLALVVNKQISHVPLNTLMDVLGFQPLDTDLTAIAALTTTTYGRALLTMADAAATRTVLGVDAAKVTSAAIATTSGTSIDFTGILAGVTRITLGLKGVSTNGTANLYIQIGDSGGIENTGYLGAKTVLTGAASSSNETVAFGWGGNAAANVYHGMFFLTLEDAATNTWTCAGGVATSNTAATVVTFGSKPLSATLDRVRLTTNGGTDAFDAGTANISWEVTG